MTKQAEAGESNAQDCGAADTVGVQWEYAVTPLLLHNEGKILNNWGKKGWELVQIIDGPQGGNVAYLKRRLTSRDGESQ